MKPKKAVIPAAGLGTRFLPATKVVPKELLPIVDRPAIEYVVEELVESGIEEVIFVISPDKEAVFEHFSMTGIAETILKKKNKLSLLKNHHQLLSRAKFRKTYQKDPLGLGHAVLCAEEIVGKEPFVVVLPDDLIQSRVPCTRQLMDLSEKENCSVVALQEVPRDQVPLYGIVSGSTPGSQKPFRIGQIVEKPKIEEAPSQWAIVGRYVLDPSIFDYLKKTKPGAIGEIQLTDGLAALSREKGLIGLPFEGRRLDAGQPRGYLEANLRYAADRKEFIDPLRSLFRELSGKGS